MSAVDTLLTSNLVIQQDQIQTIGCIPGFCKTITNVFTPEECSALIQIAEETGFTQAALYTDANGRDHMALDVRKSSRCVIDSEPFVERLWERIRDHVPSTWKGAEVVGLNPRLRILRYDPGDEFKPHMDGKYTSPSGAISCITILIYLNQGYEGGFTCFWGSTGDHEEGWIPIQPETGMITMQDQDLLHCVPPLISGRKYAIRTEVMCMFPSIKNKVFKDIVIRE